MLLSPLKIIFVLIQNTIELNNIEIVTLINYGACDKKETLKFNVDLFGASMISEVGTATIEGAELNALRGGKRNNN